MKIHLTKEAEQAALIYSLKAALKDAKSELKYHEEYLLSGDGHRCERCGKVRYIDDCVMVGDFYTCSDHCAWALEREEERGLADSDMERIRQTSFGKL